MKKNKTIAYALAATLLVGGTFVGTKALFSDKEQAYNDLVITMGNLNVDVTEGEWVNLNDKNTEATNTGSKDVFTNVKPGDRFEKKFVIKNNGTLNQKLTISGGDALQNYSKDILVGQTLSNLNNKVLKGGESVEAIIEVCIPEDTQGLFGDKEGLNLNERPTFNFNDLVAPFEINATQVN